MPVTKKINVPDDVRNLLETSFEVKQNNGHFEGVITAGQLDRKLYAGLNKVLELAGGKWNRKAQAHIFPTDPRTTLDLAAEGGEVEIQNHGFFPTPKSVTRQMVERIGLPEKWCDSILEPSAGDGAIVDELVELGANKNSITCVELHPGRVQVLLSKGYSAIESDFLSKRWKVTYGFDRVFMNPPFERRQDIDHVVRACDMLKPGGKLAAVMSAGPFFSEERKCSEFRKWFNNLGGEKVNLPDGSFKQSGTNVNAVLVFMERSV